VGGQWLSWEIESHFNLKLGIPGAIVLLSVAQFIVSALVGPKIRRQGAAGG
jgi:hypothetical protein